MINFQTATDELAKVVADADRGEHTVYARPLLDQRPVTAGMKCLYVHVTAESIAPGCVMGRWLHVYHGVPLHRLAQFDGNEPITNVLDQLGIAVTPRAAKFLRGMQSLQDIGVTWGAAYRSACESAGPELDDSLA